MLVLSRHENESVRIGDDITVRVISVENGKVRLGITAPRDVPVHRQEVYERIHTPVADDNDAGETRPLHVPKSSSSSPPALTADTPRVDKLLRDIDQLGAEPTLPAADPRNADL